MDPKDEFKKKKTVQHFLNKLVNYTLFKLTKTTSVPIYGLRRKKNNTGRCLVVSIVHNLLSVNT